MKIIESMVLDNSSEANYTYKRNHDIRIQTHSNKHIQHESVQNFLNSFKLRRMHECKIGFQWQIHKEAVTSWGCCM